MFIGSSYIAYQPPTSSPTLAVSVTFIPYLPDGLLIFSSFTENDFGDFFSVSLVDGIVQLKYSLGAGTTVVSSPMSVSINTWHRVTARLEMSNGSLLVDDQDTVFGYDASPFNTLNMHSNLFLGGYSNFINISSITGVDVGLNGCVSQLHINDRAIDLVQDAEFGFGVTQCDTDFCTGNPCLNGGSCLERGSSFVCECNSVYTGPLCGTLIDPCIEGASMCAAGATCVPSLNGLSFDCQCPLGSGGDICDEGKVIYACFGVNLTLSVNLMQRLWLLLLLSTNLHIWNIPCWLLMSEIMIFKSFSNHPNPMVLSFTLATTLIKGTSSPSHYWNVMSIFGLILAQDLQTL